MPAREEDGSVVILSTSGEALECVEIARAIHAAAARRRALRPDRHSAALAGAPPAADPGSPAARRNPVALHAAARAGPMSPGAALLALLHCAAEGLSASRFAEYLSLGQMPEEEEPRHARGLGAAAGGCRGDRRTRPLGDAPRRTARGVSPPLRRGRGGRRRARVAGAAHRSRWRISRAWRCP